MRWLVAALGVIGLAGGIYLGLEPRLRRPELRVALNLRPSNPDDDALAAGVALAIQERDERAGRYRVKTAHQILHPKGFFTVPNPGPHTMLPGLATVPHLRVEGSDAEWIPPEAAAEAVVLSSWLDARGVKRLVMPYTHAAQHGIIPGDLFHVAAYHLVVQSKAVVTWPEGGNPDAIAYQIILDRPDAVFLDFAHNPYWIPKDLVPRLRRLGFAGLCVVSGGSVSPEKLATPSFEGCHVALALLKTPPHDFLRRFPEPPHPFVYVGYRGALHYLDALDARPQENPVVLARNLTRASFLDDQRGESRVYVIRNGRLEPPK